MSDIENFNAEDFGGEQTDLDKIINESMGDDANTTQGDDGNTQEQQDNNRQQQQQQDPARQRTPSAGASANANKKTQQQGQNSGDRAAQDITLADGTVIKGGAERRLYEKSEKYRQQAEQVTQNMQQTHTQLQQLQGKVTAYEQAFNSAKELGLSPQESTVAHRLFSAYKQDPARTINYLLTQAKAAGHNVASIGGGSVDASAIKQMIAEQIQPFTEDRNRVQQQQQAQQQAQQEVQQFFTRFTDAKVHEGELARLLKRDNNLSPDAAYFMLKSFYAERGLDWSVPLSEHARRAAEQQQGQQQQQQQRGLPNGRGNGNMVSTNQPNAVDHKASWDDIINGAMRDNGLS